MATAVFNHLWQSTLFAALAALLTFALRKNRARVRHAVWLAASCKFLIPISLLISLGSQFAWRTPQAPSGISVAIDTVSEPFTGPVFASTAPLIQSAANTLPQILFGIWLCGFIGISSSWLIRWQRIRTTVRSAPSANLDLSIETKYSPTLIEPGVFGIFRPTLLLPEGIADRLTPAQLKAVIAHELCHIRHRDNLTAAIQMFIETVFWFHPLIWWLGKRMLAEREQACDEEVLRLGSDARIYAESILNVCKLYTESPLACVPGITGANLKKRIGCIMSRRVSRKLTPGKVLLLATAAIAAIAVPLVIGISDPSQVRAQSKAEAPLRFEVASVKPSPPDSPRMNIEPPGGGKLTARNVPLAWLIQFAYHVWWNQISGGPAWMTTARFDVTAKAENPNASEDEVRRMLRTVLADRFSLKFHTENREQQVYALVLAKAGSHGGPGLRAAECDASTPPDPPEPSDPRPCQVFNLSPGGRLSARTATMDEFARVLTDLTARTVNNKTGLPGRYDFNLSWTPDQATPGAGRNPDGASPNPEGSSIFTALQEKLGLKLQSERGPVETLVVDHAEKTSEN